MSKSRRQFLTHAPLALLGAAVASYGQSQQPAELPPGAPPAFGTAPAVGPEVSPSTFAEAEKLVQVELSASERARRPTTGATPWLRCTNGAPARARLALEATLAPASRLGPGAARHEGRPGAEPIRPQQDRSRTAARERRGHRLRAGDPALALDREAQAHLGAAHPHLPGAPRALQSQAALRHHAHARACARAGQDRPTPEIAAGKYRGPLHGIPWGAKDLLDTAGIRTTYGAEPFRNRVPDSRCRRGQASERRRRGAGGQAEPGRAGAQRYLVRRPDHESVAAGRRLVRLERRAGRRDGRGPGRLRHRQRDRRQHRQPLACAAASPDCGPPSAACRAPAP